MWLQFLDHQIKFKFKYCQCIYVMTYLICCHIGVCWRHGRESSMRPLALVKMPLGKKVVVSSTRKNAQFAANLQQSCTNAVSTNLSSKCVYTTCFLLAENWSTACAQLGARLLKSTSILLPFASNRSAQTFLRVV